MMRGLQAGSLVGRCNFCANKIQEGVLNVSSKYAFVNNAKWLCGDCIVGMADKVADTYKKATYWVKMMETINVDIEPDYVVDLETGKLVPVGNKKK